MEQLLNLVDNINTLEDFKLTSFGCTKRNSMHFVIVYVVNSEQSSVDLELNNRNKAKVKQYLTSILHNVVFVTSKPLQTVLTLLERDTQRVVDRGGMDSLEQWLSYDMTAYLPWCHKFPHLEIRGNFTPIEGTSCTEITEKIGTLLDYCYNNPLHEATPEFDSVGSSLGWADKSWLTSYFNLYEFCMILIDSFSFNFASIHWQNYDDQYLFFTVNVIFKLNCYHDAMVPKNKKIKPIRVKMDPSMSAIEHYKLYNYGITKFDMILPCMFKIPKQVIAEKIKWWREQHGINFFIH